MSLEDALHRMLGLYMEAPGWARHALGTAYRTLPPSWRYGSRYRQFYGEAVRGPSGIGGDEFDHKLRTTLCRAVADIPAYRHLAEAVRPDRSALDCLRRFPVTSKADIKRDPERYRSPQGRGVSMFTGGSTAQPMSFVLEPGVTRVRETAYHSHINRALLRQLPGEWTLSLRGRTVASANRTAGALWTLEPVKRHLILSSDHLERRYLPRYLEALRRCRPTAIHAFPSALFPLARWLEHSDEPVLREVRGVLLTSENVYPFQDALFRRVFRCPIIRHYGHSERAVLATSLPDDERYHVWPAYGVVELLDDGDRVIDSPGVLGEIVVTGFDNAVQPFIRYRTGDLGRWDRRPEFGERVSCVLRSVEGRRQEFVVCRDDRLVSITTLGAAHFSALAPVDEIQFEQFEPGRLQLKVVATTPLTAAARREIAAAVVRKTQGGCEVEVIETPSLRRTPRGKLRMLIQHLDLSSFDGAAVLPMQQEALLADSPA